MRRKNVATPQEALIKKLDYEIKILDNMEKRVSTYTTRLSYCSYVDRILLRIDYTRRAVKDLKNRLVFFPEKCSGDDKGNIYADGKGRDQS